MSGRPSHTLHHLRLCLSACPRPVLPVLLSRPGKHPNAGDGLWGSSEEVPTFLYAMPLGGNRVFLEETCLVAKPALPFAVLKRRLERRLDAMGVTVKKVGVLFTWGDGVGGVYDYDACGYRTCKQTRKQPRKGHLT